MTERTINEALAHAEIIRPWLADSSVFTDDTFFDHLETDFVLLADEVKRLRKVLDQLMEASIVHDPLGAEIASLEFEVIQAAIEWREAAFECEQHFAQHFDFTKGYSVMNGDLSRAITATGTEPLLDKERSLGKVVVVTVDDLIAARKRFMERINELSRRS